jgi:Cu/Ag efflux pump CusA
VVEAIERNNGNVGAGYVERRGEQFLIRAPGQVRSLDDIRNTIVNNVRGVPIRVRDVATVGLGQELRTGAATENGKARACGSFVPEAEAAIARSVKIPAGYWTSWGGTFEQLQSATQRLKTVVPLALFLVLTLLFVMFGNLKDGLLVFTGIPFALTGGIVALSLRGNPLSITAAQEAIQADRFIRWRSNRSGGSVSQPTPCAAKAGMNSAQPKLRTWTS